MPIDIPDSQQDVVNSVEGVARHVADMEESEAEDAVNPSSQRKRKRSAFRENGTSKLFHTSLMQEGTAKEPRS